MILVKRNQTGPNGDEDDGRPKMIGSCFDGPRGPRALLLSRTIDGPRHALKHIICDSCTQMLRCIPPTNSTLNSTDEKSQTIEAERQNTERKHSPKNLRIRKTQDIYNNKGPLPTCPHLYSCSRQSLL